MPPGASKAISKQQQQQHVKYDFTADLTGIGDRSEYEICEM